jgi:hypothetical protein
MFLVSSAKPIDPQLRNLVDQIEKQSPGLSVLAARQFRYSQYQTPVDVTITQPRTFNVLEEFIIRAGLELVPPPTENELASVLGLDLIFVQSTTATLRALQTLEVTSDSSIKLTLQGREFYEQGSVPQEPQTKQIYALADPLQRNLTFRSSPSPEGLVDLPDLAELVTIKNRIPDIACHTLEELQYLVQASGLGLHVPEEGKIITSCTVAPPTQTIWQTISLFVLFDVLEDELTIQVRRGKQILEKASDWLKQLQSQRKLSLIDLFQLSEERIASDRNFILDEKNQEVEARIEKIRQKALETARASRGTGDIYSAKTSGENGSVVLLRDRQIRDEFLATLKYANQQILIYSPWVSKEVVDDEFIRLLQNLAKNGVWILIGHGIARKQEDETRPIPLEVEAKLLAVRTEEGLPAVQIFWLGNSHVKEIVVDRQIYLSGSHNWLSYRGDKVPRGETVHKVTIPTIVQEAYEFLAGRFQSHARQLWDEAMRNWDSTLAEAPLCLWGALSMEEEALKQLQHNNWLELLPVWLNVVCQGLRSKTVSTDSAYLASALSLLSQISEEYPNIDSLRKGWQKVIGTIASQNPERASRLLSDEVWSQFTRLGIAQPPINSPDKFISKYTVKQPDRSSKPERQNPSIKKRKRKT